MPHPRILIASPVRQDPEILRAFLRSQSRLVTEGLDVRWVFVDDNTDPASSAQLRDFADHHPTDIWTTGPAVSGYAREDETHVWSHDAVSRVTAMKDRILAHATETRFDAVFLVDSDIVLHPQTLGHLWNCNVDIVAEVYWTCWRPDEPEMPQVWRSGDYDFCAPTRGRQVPEEELGRQAVAFVVLLRKPGLYEVGGLGACTLISRRALDRGVSFREIPTLPYWGEDRHFCVRAQALGLRLWASTWLPPLHLYRDEDLSRVSAFEDQEGAILLRDLAVAKACEAILRWGTRHSTKTSASVLDAFTDHGRESPLPSAPAGEYAEQLDVVSGSGALTRAGVHVDLTLVRTGRHGEEPVDQIVEVTAEVLHRESGDLLIDEVKVVERPNEGTRPQAVRQTRGNRVLLSMIVRNEAHRYLRNVLSHAASYVDEVLILDDASDDDTVEVCREVLSGLSHQVVSLHRSEFNKEYRLRRIQWELAAATRADWILCLDADERFEDRVLTDLPALVNQDAYDAVAFRLYDLWKPGFYRDDRWWCAHRTYRTFLVRNLPGFQPRWRNADQHCGRFPENVAGLTTAVSPLRLMHLGWMNAVDRELKVRRYRELDPDARFGIREQYESILDADPHLVPWTE